MKWAERSEVYVNLYMDGARRILKVIDENTVPVDWTQRRNYVGSFVLYFERR